MNRREFIVALSAVGVASTTIGRMELPEDREYTQEDVTNSSQFIPELWSEEILEQYKRNIIAQGLFLS